MEDKCQEVLKKYPLKVYNIYRARGAYLLETDSGLKLLKCFEGSRNRALFEDNVKEHLYMHGYYNTDLYVKTLEGDIIAIDQFGCKYIVKNWFWGEECNLKELSQIEIAAANLAKLHCLLRNVDISMELTEFNISANLHDIFEKRNRELKRVKSYVRDKRQKNEFEVIYLNYYDEFYEQGLDATKRLLDSGYSELLEDSIYNNMVCHGNYTYHNIIMLKNRNESSEWKKSVATTNFEKAHIGLQITDLYQFIRKVMEKNNWDILYGNNIIEAYDRIQPISKKELGVLYVLLLYPEKFWKITNFYYNSKKAWISRRNIQKLNSIGEQNPKKDIFLKRLENIL